VNRWIDENSTLIVIVLAVLVVLLLIAGFVLLFLVVRARRSRTDDSSERVNAELDRIELELSLAEQAGRLRIIRELHEVAVHSISVIIGQADGAQYAGIKYPRAAVRAASVIAESARDTLADLRRVMTVVRDGEAEITSHPELQSVRELFTVMEAAGLEIEFAETGERYDLKPGAELAVYRIVQAALHNSLTHGGVGTHVTVGFTWTGEGFQVAVDDDGVRAATRRAGLDPNEVAQQGGYDSRDDLAALTGVVGGAEITEMRERTELFGGVFTATTVPGVGFSIAASFPALRFHNGVHGVNLGA
jgi:signal transduction histidine kinase